MLTETELKLREAARVTAAAKLLGFTVITIDGTRGHVCEIHEDGELTVMLTSGQRERYALNEVERQRP
jgi:hypothetical protein